MYSLAVISLKYVRYFITAANGRGHGVHSPFVFDFIKNVLNDKRQFYAFDTIENARNNLLASKAVILVNDMGAGSAVMPTSKRRVSAIAKSSLKPARFGQLMFRMVNYYHFNTMVELGTSLGITTSYMALANTSGRVITMEGSSEIAALAQLNFWQLKAHNIKLVEGNFDDTLPNVIASLKKVDLAFIDGNHRREPTLQYFTTLLSKTHQNSILIFDDIHWSSSMENAWKIIKNHPSVTLTIDLFFVGLVFFRKEQKQKQHFSIRF